MRLQRYLSRSGSAPSRRKAEEMIQTGRVRVNGRVATIGDGAGSDDTVELDGEPVELPVEHAYLALNKPSGYLTTLQDEPGKSRPTVTRLMPRVPGLVPVGRLDAETTGLLLFTNDGALAHRITHPSREVEKEYLVTVSGNAPEGALDALAAGPDLDDGPMSPPGLRDVETSGLSTSFRLTIHEGRNRIIRRACAAVGLEVVGLHRIRVGPVAVGELEAGEYRSLYQDELERLP
ncbi:pseudouridine synthase [Rubrobacter aplysinae]|uniref:pseudouridine synthase n=1 Tax=Rubrobacter aplysinae TaxID=909625 RepID=UPI00064BCA42|nr:pseudouridine synthase [Rubrobacter aplysinae]